MTVVKLFVRMFTRVLDYLIGAEPLESQSSGGGPSTLVLQNLDAARRECREPPQRKRYWRSSFDSGMVTCVLHDGAGKARNA